MAIQRLLAAAQTRLRKSFPSGLKYWWKLQTDYADSVGGKNGTPSGSLSFATHLGRKALRLVPNGGWVTIPNLTFGNQPWTLSLWYAPVDMSVYHHLLSSEDHATLLFKIARSDDPNAGKSYVYAASALPAGSKFSSIVVPSGVWTLITYVYDGSTLKFYFNNVLRGSSPVTMNVPARNFRIGYGNAGEYSKGYQSDVRIFDRALTVQEIEQIMNTVQ